MPLSQGPWLLRSKYKLLFAVVLLCFSVTSLPAQTLTTLHSFNGTDGNGPNSGLVQGLDGNFYGTTVYGGIMDEGTIYRVTPSGVVTTIYSFSGPDGANPFAPLVLGIDGNFYGTTNIGGQANVGTIFRVTPSGSLTTLHSLKANQGENPYGGLVQATDGNFYGTAEATQEVFTGSVFKITPSGAFTLLHIFGSTPGDGDSPYDALVEGSDGNLYGTTFEGGSAGAGTVFKVTPTGTVTVVHNFCTQGGSCPDGSNPTAGLIQAADGNFYGVTARGGIPACSIGPYPYCGTVFKITPSGTLTRLHLFDYTDGGNPIMRLVQGSDGNFYGTTQVGGSNVSASCTSGCGTAFSITASGTFSLLYNFCSVGACLDGSAALPSMIQGTDGNFYGVTPLGGDNNFGTFYRLSTGLGPFVSALPNYGHAGGTVRILGTALTGATSVSFNGTSSAFTVMSDSLIQTTVPAGATSGTIQVVTPGGTFSSKVSFRVR